MAYSTLWDTKVVYFLENPIMLSYFMFHQLQLITNFQIIEIITNIQMHNSR